MITTLMPDSNPIVSIEEREYIESLIAQLNQAPGALIASERAKAIIVAAHARSPSDYYLWRQKVKDAKAFPIRDFDRLTSIADGDNSTTIDELIEIGKKEATLFHDESGDGYADVSRGSIIETFPIRSDGFTKWLRSRYYCEFERGVADQILKGAVESLVAIAVNDGEKHQTYLRVAKVGGSYFLDLGNDLRSVVEINEDSWRLLTNSPVKLIRSANTRPLPKPVEGCGDLSRLWKHVNVRESDRLFVLAFLLESLRPETPFVLLMLMGEQGSAKSNSQRRLRELIDPNRVNLRGAPKNCEDIAVAADKNLLVSYENLSSLSAEQQDMLCMILTGGGIAKRQLYSNFDESAIQLKRPIVLNGISTVITRLDLLDRAIILDLPTISEIARREQSVCDEEWSQDYASIFAGLLDLFAKTLRIIPDINLIEAPRMADFARLGEAMAIALGNSPGVFLEMYKKAREEVHSIILEGDPVAMALDKYLEKNPYGFDLTTGRLYELLNQEITNFQKDFPRTPRGLGNSLRRLKPLYRQRGWDIDSTGRKEKGVMVSMRRISKDITELEHAGPAVIHDEGLYKLNVESGCDRPSTGSIAHQECSDDKGQTVRSTLC